MGIHPLLLQLIQKHYTLNHLDIDINIKGKPGKVK